MKKFLCLATVIGAASIASTADAKSQGLTCAYRLHGSIAAYAVVHGSDNTPSFCNIMRRVGYRVYYVSGPIRCTFAMTYLNVYVDFRTYNRYLGGFVCSHMESSLGSGWVRTR